MWDWAAGVRIGQPVDDEDGSAIDTVAFSPNGASLALGDFAGNVVLVPSLYWVASYSGAFHDLCSEVRGNLTQQQWDQYVPNQPFGKACPAYP